MEVYIATGKFLEQNSRLNHRKKFLKLVSLNYTIKTHSDETTIFVNNAKTILKMQKIIKEMKFFFFIFLKNICLFLALTQTLFTKTNKQ